MSVVRIILGFLVGIIASGTLLFLISVRSPMPEGSVPEGSDWRNRVVDEETSDAGEVKKN